MPYVTAEEIQAIVEKAVAEALGKRTPELRDNEYRPVEQVRPPGVQLIISRNPDTMCSTAACLKDPRGGVDWMGADAADIWAHPLVKRAFEVALALRTGDERDPILAKAHYKNSYNAAGKVIGYCAFPDELWASVQVKTVDSRKPWARQIVIITTSGTAGYEYDAAAPKHPMEPTGPRREAFYQTQGVRSEHRSWDNLLLLECRRKGDAELGEYDLSDGHMNLVGVRNRVASYYMGCEAMEQVTEAPPPSRYGAYDLYRGPMDPKKLVA